MPVQNKTRWAQLRVGIMAIVALAILFTLIFLMAGSQGLFKPKTVLYTYMGDSSALAVGAPVRLNGILIGKVTAIDLSGMDDPRRVVRIAMQVDNEYLPSIPVDSTANVAAENLLGTKFINIKKGKAKETVKPGAEISSADTAELEDLFQQGATTISALQITLKRLDGIIAGIESGNGTIGKLLVDETLYKKVISITDEAQKLVATLNESLNNQNSNLGKLLHDDALYVDLQTGLGKVNTILDGLQQGQGAAGKFLKDDALYEDIRKTIGDTRALIAQINSDQGTVGKLIKTDELHTELKQNLAKLDSILDKLNTGQGTLGQLLVNPSLYESIEGSTRELQGLLRDFRTNPKKFLRIKLGLF